MAYINCIREHKYNATTGGYYVDNKTVCRECNRFNERARSTSKRTKRTVVSIVFDVDRTRMRNRGERSLDNRPGNRATCSYSRTFSDAKIDSRLNEYRRRRFSRNPRLYRLSLSLSLARPFIPVVALILPYASGTSTKIRLLPVQEKRSIFVFDTSIDRLSNIFHHPYTYTHALRHPHAHVPYTHTHTRRVV